MSLAPTVAPQNLLLAALPRKDFKQFLGACAVVDLNFGEVLAEPGERVKHVYFPTQGFISLVAPIDGRPALEVGLVGNEGMLGVALMLGVDTSPLHALVQGAGSALRMEAAQFKRQAAESTMLNRLLKRYLYVTLEQCAQTAACTRFHLVKARLARWLLMTQDRAHADAFHITHEFLAYMLGVRRVGITKAATALQQEKLIRYIRGDIQILDRRGLEAASCSCYGVDRTSYLSILG